MEYVEIASTEERMIKFGLSEVDRYKTGEDASDDPWWEVHLIVKKPGIDYCTVQESMTQRELKKLAAAIERSKAFDVAEKEIVDFIEPDYWFELTQWHGILNVNLRHADSLQIWLTRENLNDIVNYINIRLAESGT